MPDLLRQRLKMDAETFDKAVEKLIAQGAATIDMAGNVRASEDAPHRAAWRKGYDDQIAFRRSQIDRMVQFAESPQCRMAALIQHFGDTADGLRPCGHCDFCAPQNATAQAFRTPPPKKTANSAPSSAHSKAKPAPPANSTPNSPPTHSATPRRRPQDLRYSPRRANPSRFDHTERRSVDQPEGNLITFKKASLTHEGRTLTGPCHPTSSSKTHQPTQRLLHPGKNPATAPAQNHPKPR